MRHPSRIVRNSWGVFSAVAPPVATRLCGTAPQRASGALNRPSSPAHQSWLVVPCIAQVGLRALAVLEGLEPSAPRADFPQGCDGLRRPVKFWARRRLPGPHRPHRVPGTSPKARRNPPHRHDALARPAVVSPVVVPARLLAGDPGVRIGMIRHAWSSCDAAALPASSAPRFTSLASMTKT